MRAWWSSRRSGKEAGEAGDPRRAALSEYRVSSTLLAKRRKALRGGTGVVLAMEASRANSARARRCEVATMAPRRVTLSVETPGSARARSTDASKLDRARRAAARVRSRLGWPAAV